ncbi:MAG: hypothetical protein A2040_13825 [Rhodocyclales bacterium GWA2_65_19]|nr:MAG: hypothetical protein A2040_13825 [Rhodocyclales bacterium GWA2_65_19]
MAYRTIWETNGICVRYSGHSSDREIALLVHEFQADERFDNVRYILHDFRDCENLTYSKLAIEELSAIDAAAAMSKPEHRVAVVSDRPDVLGMVKAYMDTGFQAKDQLRIFSSLEAARSWACVYAGLIGGADHTVTDTEARAFA